MQRANEFMQYGNYAAGKLNYAVDALNYADGVGGMQLGSTAAAAAAVAAVKNHAIW
jgi:hypothetical protein